MSDLFWIALSKINKMGPKSIKMLYEYNSALNYADFFSDSNLKKIIKNQSVYENIRDREIFENKIVEARQLVKLHKEVGIQVISFNSINYPKLLRYIEDPPPILYCKGNIDLLKESNAVAVVGTREPTRLGVAAAKKIAREFAFKGYTIVSGLALGIDTAGHKGALEVPEGKTIAILAGSLNTIYPAQNKELAEEIINRKGLLLSETALGQKTFKGSFVARDRLQSGISIGICPVQAPLKSGTNHTINFALKQNRVIFCPIPLEPQTVEATQGIYKLLETDGIELIATVDDYLKIEKKLHNKKIELFTNKSNIEKNIKKNDEKDNNLENNEINEFNLFSLPEEL